MVYINDIFVTSKRDGEHWRTLNEVLIKSPLEAGECLKKEKVTI